MAKRLLFFITVSLFLSLQVAAQDDWNHIDEKILLSKDTIKKVGYTLLFFNADPQLNDTVKQQLISTYFTVYPKEVKMYNSSVSKQVIFYIDPAYDGVAATSAGLVRFNPAWFHKHPHDIDVVTHEVMHIVQAYPDEAGPGWLTEGIADYVRYTLGVDNKSANWALPDYNPKQNYDNAYRITARFLVWIENHKYKGFVKKMDAAMRSKKYKPEMWKQLTGSTVDELWKEYSKNPVL